MASPHIIPKIQIKADVTLEGRPVAVYKMFLTQASTGEHCERPSEMLNGSRSFLPVVDSHGRILFLPLKAIILVSIPAAWEFRHIGSPLLTAGKGEIMTAAVEVELLDGTTISGKVRYIVCEDKRRMQDHLNHVDSFLTLEHSEAATFVNKRHVARISPVQ